MFSHVLPLGLVGVVTARRFASHTMPAAETVSPASGSTLFASLLSHAVLVCTATLLHLALVYNLTTVKHGHVLDTNVETPVGNDCVDSAVEIVSVPSASEDDTPVHVEMNQDDDDGCDDSYDFCLHDE